MGPGEKGEPGFWDRLGRKENRVSLAHKAGWVHKERKAPACKGHPDCKENREPGLQGPTGPQGEKGEPACKGRPWEKKASLAHRVPLAPKWEPADPARLYVLERRIAELEKRLADLKKPRFGIF
jgi:hypothetical protein